MSSVAVWGDKVVNVFVSWDKHAFGPESGFEASWYGPDASLETSYPAGLRKYRSKEEAERFGRRKALELHVQRAHDMLRRKGDVEDETTGIAVRRSGSGYSLQATAGADAFAEAPSVEDASGLLGLLAYAAESARSELRRMAYEKAIPEDAEGLGDLPPEVLERVRAAASLSRRKAMSLVKEGRAGEAEALPLRAADAWLSGRHLEMQAQPRP